MCTYLKLKNVCGFNFKGALATYKNAVRNESSRTF